MADDTVLNATAFDRLLRIGGQDFLLEMIDLFLDHSPQRLASARAGLAAGDHPQLYRAAHSLKSTAANLGAEELQAVAERVEGLSSSGDVSGVAPLLDELERCYERVRDRLEAERRRRRGDQ